MWSGDSLLRVLVFKRVIIGLANITVIGEGGGGMIVVNKMASI